MVTIQQLNTNTADYGFWPNFYPNAINYEF